MIVSRYPTYYFSTQGCRFWLSLGGASLDEEAPFVAAAAARALLSKKFDIMDNRHKKIVGCVKPAVKLYHSWIGERSLSNVVTNE